MIQPMPTFYSNSNNNFQNSPPGTFRNNDLLINEIPPPLTLSLDSSPQSFSSTSQPPSTTKAINTAKQPLNKQFQSSNYQSFADISDSNQNPHLFIQVASGQKISRPWQVYIGDLDDFFERIYRYYIKSGFTCILMQNIFELIEILFVILLTFFFFNFVDYDILFKRKNPPGHENKSSVPIKVTIIDCLIPFSEVTLTSLEVILLVFAFAFWITKFGIAIYTIYCNYAIRLFFIEALQIYDPSSYSWQEVQVRLINAQSLCLLRETHLDELAIHNRLLRRTNYMIALINKGVLPIYYRLPFLGECIYLTSGLEFNLNILLFRGIFSLFEKNWKLRDEIKINSERLDCARRFSNRCLAIGLINLLLFPFIMFWQLLYAFYTNVEAMKRDPSVFSSRTWSRYGRWYCRHFNELEHELDERLNRAHRPAIRYMNKFTSPLMEIIARFIRFISTMFLSVLIVLTIYDEDVIAVEHVLTIITCFSATIAIASAFLPFSEENRWSFAELDSAILHHIHYRPHNYPPHTIQARNGMSNIFIYKIYTLMEELVSPIFTPYILIKHLRSKSLEIVDFFRIYTLERTDIGDVCTFSQFNFSQNGHRMFNKNNQLAKSHLPTDKIEPSTSKNIPDLLQNDDNLSTCNGKLELSLINFKLTNPKWQPQNSSQQQFIDQFTKESKDLSIRLEFNKNKKMGDSQSTIGDCTPSTSTSQRVHPKNDELMLLMNNSSQINDSLFLDRDIDFGFRHERYRLMQLQNASIFSEREERDNQMALSSLYLHQLINERQQQQITATQGRKLSQSLAFPTNAGTITSFSGQRIKNESIPLLRSDRKNQEIDEDEELDGNDLDQHQQ